LRSAASGIVDDVEAAELADVELECVPS
jgi:hypothetical protein